MNLKKILAFALSAVLAISCTFALIGCSEDPTKVIRDSLTEQLNAYKNADDSALSQIASLAENEGLSEMGIDNQEFAVAVLDGFDYSIDDITVDGKNATANVTIISKSYADFAEKIKVMVDEMSSDASLADMDADALTALVAERVMDVLNNTEINTETLAIDYVLNGNEWQPVAQESAFASLDSVVFHK